MTPLLSDERLSRRLATGEAAAFDELYRRYSHRLAAYAASLLGDRPAGEDVAQVALLNAYQALRRGRVPDRVRPWLFRIAHNEAIDLLRRRRELLHGIDADERAAPEEPVAERGALLDALGKLPDRQRRAYVLREVHGLRVAEIAAELSLAAPQVEQALFAARNRLAEELVFPDGLTCDGARRLLEGPLAGVERRALRRHFRTCARCRADGVRVAPGLSLDWLRGRLADVLVGGFAPAAAKGTALVAATVAGTGVAVGPKLLEREPHPHFGVANAAVAPRPPREARPSPRLAYVALAPATSSVPARHEDRHVERQDDHRGSDDRRETTATRHGEDGGREERTATTPEHRDGGSGDRHGSTDGGDDAERPQTTTHAETPTETETTTLLEVSLPSTTTVPDGGGD